MSSGTLPEPRSLSPRQTEILKMVAIGATREQVARALEISVRTVGRHLGDIYIRWGVPNRAAAVLTGLRLGVL